MPLDIRILAEEDDGEGRSVEVRLTARPRADEDPLEDSRLFAAGDRTEITRFVASLIERHAGALPLRGHASCQRCRRVFDPEAEGETRRPFVCRRCQRKAAGAGGAPAAGEGVEALFLGTGDAFGSAGRRQAAILLRARGQSRGVLLDAGPGCHTALRREGLSGEDLAAVVLSHFHGDHYGGFPFLELDGRRTGRRAPLLVLAPPGARERIESLRRCLYSDLRVGFPEEIREALPGEETPLPEASGGGTAVPFLADHQPGAWAFFWKLRLGGRTIVYSGDTAFSERLLAEAADADLLIHECTALDPLPGHTSHAELARAAPRITARRVLLVHTGEEVLEAAETAFERAHDGLRVVV